jgi:hypothetical protein
MKLTETIDDDSPAGDGNTIANKNDVEGSR